MNKEQVRKIKLFEFIIQSIDAVFIVMFMGVFIFLFTNLQVPTTPPVTDDILLYTYHIFGREMSAASLNTVISLSAIVLLVTVPLFFVNLKKTLNREFYEYSPWTSGTIFTQSIISLLSANVFSFGLRLYVARRILKQTVGYGYITVLQHLGQSIKKMFTKKEASTEDDELKKKIRKQIFSKIFVTFGLYFFLAIMALFIFIPFYWMLLTALKTYYESNITLTPRFFISLSEMQWINFRYVLEEINFGIYIKNTLIVGIFSTIGTLLTTILAAFAFSRLEFKGRDTIFSILLMTMMIPGELYIITNFLTVSQAGVGWIGGAAGNNQYFLAMIVPFMTSVFYIFFLRQTFKQIPDTLYQAAKVDGSSDFKYLTRVMLPIAAPTIFTITILNVIGSWNAFIWPRLVTSVGDVQEGQMFWLISAALRDADFTTGGTDARIMFNMQIAASAMVTIPLIIVFLLLRKYIMSGVGRSGIKG